MYIMLYSQSNMLTEEDKALYAEQFTNENINFI